MITLKKSFELQNYLRGLYDSALNIMLITDNVTETKQEHMHKKVYAEVDDEVVIKPKRNEFDCTVNDLIDFACFVQKEMERLTGAINAVKRTAEHDFDGMIAINNQKRKLLERMTSLASIKSRESIVQGRGFKFNEEGNQTTYVYDIKEVVTIDFDRNKVKAIANRLRKELDTVSTDIDMMQLSVKVDFESIFEIGDSLEEAIEKWLAATSCNDSVE